MLSTTQIGRDAENLVVDMLISRGYKILGQNWKTKTCEIDVIASKMNVVCFVEVKYRANSMQGSGFEYITQSKIRQMSYAANYWTAKYCWKGEIILCAAEVNSKYKINLVKLTD